ncbi:ribosomal protein S18-alanine N-acetyltransferase [Georgenia sunbinii]|uniref:ribosomal protein S18-alanine N-acetyltransferase n=1 Tax=Georgenia sunbinii TaxID=3117728 RepID=UPI002F2628A4
MNRPSVLLRPLRPTDLERIAQLEVELFGAAAWSRSMYEDELAQPDRYYVAAEVAGNLVGYAGIALASDAQVMTVGVTADQRRRGIATLLVADLVERARAGRSNQVFLEVRAGDLGAQELYRRAGFEPIGTRRRYYQPDGEDAVVMRLTLRAGALPLGR